LWTNANRVNQRRLVIVRYSVPFIDVQVEHMGFFDGCD
jgi:hypothetical protein